MSRQFLNIEQKEDTAAKTAAVEGKATKHYLFDWEINAIVDRVKLLFQLNSSNSVNLWAIQNADSKLELGEIDDLIGHINNGEIIELAKNTYILYSIGETNYIEVYVGETKEVGTDSGQITEDDLIVLFDSSLPVAPLAQREIKLIGTDYVLLPEDKSKTLVLRKEDFVFYIQNSTFNPGDETEIINLDNDLDPSLVISGSNVKIYYQGELKETGNSIAFTSGKRGWLKCVSQNTFSLTIA